MGKWEKNIPGRGNNKYKDPEVGACLTCSSNSEE